MQGWRGVSILDSAGACASARCWGVADLDASVEKSLLVGVHGIGLDDLENCDRLNVSITLLF